MSSVRTPKQKRGIATRKQIIQAAFRLFAQKGIHGTNSTEIAKQAGISTGSFYAYFKNKKTLLLEMLEDYLEQHFRTAWRPLDGFDPVELDRQTIRRIILSVFEAYDLAPEFHRQTHALRYSDADIKRVYDREREREIDQIRHILAKNRSRLVNAGDLELTALLIHNSVENVAHTAKFMGTAIDEKRLADGLADMIAGFVLDSGPRGG
ncbi:MAG: TetR/AcrR family transcriptional regulator [Desulfobacterales bacterium]|nr:TetR/AcrR family transcriptional regulator [Desulfobacterales bacterium]MDJ0857307.1 TetR/AcrR family transcriptional regulator [Desulfobacterales bacterium]